MTIDVSDILSREGASEEFSGEFEIHSIELSGADIRADLGTYTVRVSNEDGSTLAVVADPVVRVTRPCDRCTCDVTEEYELHVDEVFPITDEAVSTDPDEDGQWFDGNELLIDRMVADELLLVLPPKVLCKDDCRGLCPVCGMDLNHGSCDCDRSVLDPRMAKILDVFAGNDR